MYKLISTISLIEADFPLMLPPPTRISSGGYLLPNSVEAYSPIDLLVAGLEANRINLIVTNLVSFFDKHKLMLSDNWVRLSILGTEDSVINYWSISEIKSKIVSDIDYSLLRIMYRNAPLTFKWTKL